MTGRTCALLTLLAVLDARAEVTVAFLGDQGLGPDAEAVLQLVVDEGSDAVVLSGDFDYGDDPAAWAAMLDDVLGPDFPYFVAVGNHDEDSYYGAGGYQSYAVARMQQLGIAWSGDLGVKSSFEWRGIRFVMTAPGIPFGSGYDSYIRDRFAADTTSLWRVSSWHKNQTLMQVGSKANEAGWAVYEAARRAGAITATAHEHSYSRTHLLSDCDTQQVASTAGTLELAEDDPATPADEGRSFVFVSGLGGRSIRNQDRDGAWWASIYTSDQDATHGALFGVFDENGQPGLAHFYFKAIDGTVVDDFYVRSARAPIPQCANGIDDDGDGNVDLADRQCQDANDPSEAPAPIPLCGVGAELLLVLLPIGALRSLRRS
jgi:hypothetical protein